MLAPFLDPLLMFLLKIFRKGDVMDFVVYVLKEIFNHTDQQANEIMLKVHNEGEASCGIFTKDLAETKSYEVNNLAKINDHPLISIVKPIYD